MPATIITSKGVNLIHYDGLEMAEKIGAIGSARDEEGFETLWGREQQIGWFIEDARFDCLSDITVPQSATAPNKAGVIREAIIQIIEQRTNRADVQNTETSPILLHHLGQHGKHGGLGLAAGGRSEQEAVQPVQNRCDRFVLQRAKLAPAERIDNVVLQGRMEPVESRHSFNSTLSTETASRSCSVRSAIETVRA